jgi:hypothetical protein
MPKLAEHCRHQIAQLSSAMTAASSHKEANERTCIVGPSTKGRDF